MTINPQIALFAALLAALGGQAQAGSHDENETGEFGKTQAALYQFADDWTSPDPYASSGEYIHEIEVISRSSK